MTELIVALDLDSSVEAGFLAERLINEADVRWFKLGPRAFMTDDRYGRDLIDDILRGGAQLFLDLKLYDTHDTVRATAKRAFALGATMLTVHPTPPMLNAAMTAKDAPEQKVIAVPVLTDTGYSTRYFAGMAAALVEDNDGVVCPPMLLAALRYPNGGLRSFAKDKIVITPGIRRSGQAVNNHKRTVTPDVAKQSRADFIVVGRPIYTAADPIESAREIMKELR